MTKNIFDNTPWWKSAVIYQIYPRSFFDADNNGIGDLKGIIEKLDYLNDGNGGGLGIDGIWISPFFKSPMADFGYDVSDYCDVDPIFGTLDDYDILVQEAHKRGVKILIDLVLNHTSDQHPWFKESKKSKKSDKSDWYVWADPKENGNPPNNWLSIFGGPAWTYVPNRKQYYFHNFIKEQPDLNWYHPEVREVIAGIVQFWLDRGTDGFRLDAVNFYAYDQKLRDNPLVPEGYTHLEDTDFNPYYKYDTIYSKDRPENMEFVKFLRSLFDKGKDITSIGEVGSVSDLEKVIQVAADHTKGNSRLHMAYTFSMLNDKADFSHISNVLSMTESKMMGGWPCWSLGNHDTKRVKTRYGCIDKKDGLEQSFLLFLLSLRGTPVLYYGDEISMEDVDIKKEELQDPYGIQFWPDFKGRDGCRTPFSWDKSLQNSGFNEGTSPWLPTRSNTDLKTCLNNASSTFHVVKEMIRIRKQYPALSCGDYQEIISDPDYFVFKRLYKDQTILAGMNISEEPQQINLPEQNQNFEDIRIKAFDRNGEVRKGTLMLPSLGFYLGIKTE